MENMLQVCIACNERAIKLRDYLMSCDSLKACTFEPIIRGHYAFRVKIPPNENGIMMLSCSVPFDTNMQHALKNEFSIEVAPLDINEEIIYGLRDFDFAYGSTNEQVEKDIVEFMSMPKQPKGLLVDYDENA